LRPLLSRRTIDRMVEQNQGGMSVGDSPLMIAKAQVGLAGAPTLDGEIQ
jgi:hypothetical protein